MKTLTKEKIESKTNTEQITFFPSLVYTHKFQHEGTVFTYDPFSCDCINVEIPGTANVGDFIDIGINQGVSRNMFVELVYDYLKSLLNH